MKHIICIVLTIIIIILLMTAVAISNPGQTLDPDKSVQYSITEVINGSFTPPDIYEIHYRTTFSNGLIVDRWTEVTKEEYTRNVKHEYSD